MDKNNEDYYSYTKDMFKKIAPFYDIVDLFVYGARKKLVESTNLENNSKILDVCCGTGSQAIKFAKKGYKVTGIDLSEDMLKVAEKKNRHNVKFVHGDATAMPYEDNLFDMSYSSFALHDMPPGIRKKILAEMKRVTKPKGSVIIVDYSLPENKIKKFLMCHFIKLYESKYYPEFIKSGIKKLIKDSGIEIKKEIPVMFGTAKIFKGINKK